MTAWMQGHPSPLRQWCISHSCFRFPPLIQKFVFWLHGKFSQFCLFLETFLIFVPLTTNFKFPPYFHCFVTFPLYFGRKLLFFPLLQMSPRFHKNHVFFYILSEFFCFPPCFDHDAFMHHIMHALDVSVEWKEQNLEFRKITMTESCLMVGHSYFSKLQILFFHSTLLDVPAWMRNKHLLEIY